MPDKRVVIWGAGRIGRGFVADLFSAGGYSITFVGRSTQRMGQLRDAGRYTVAKVRSGQRTDEIIEGFAALSADQAEETGRAVAQADVVAIAVFVDELPVVAQQLAPGIVRRFAERPDAALDIVLCINPNDRAAEFRALLLDRLPNPGVRAYVEQRVGVVNAMAMRAVVEPPAAVRDADPLLVWTDGGRVLAVDRHAFKNGLPQVPGLRLVDDMKAEGTRKLYTYNMVHASLAYLGLPRGHTLSVDALADPIVRAGVEGALDEAGRAVQAEFGFSADEMQALYSDLWDRYSNRALGDRLRRLAADPRRKLRRSERLVGPALLALRHCIKAAHLIRVIAAALRYDDPSDAGSAHIRRRIADAGLPAAVREVLELTEAESHLAEMVVHAYAAQAG